MMAFNKQMALAFTVYVKCPTTGRTLDAIPGDDKVICNCADAVRHGGTHLVSRCEQSTVEQWMTEHGIADGDA